MVELNSAPDAPGCVLAAIDMGPTCRRVLLHAAGLARLLSIQLKVLHVGADTSAEQREHVLDYCSVQGPYEVDLTEDDILLRTGLVSEAIYREATKQHARLVVMGSRGHGPLTAFLLGSTTQAVLRNAPAPILLVPPVDLDIVNITDRAQPSCGPVLAAVDLADPNDQQLRFAGELAQLAGQPLLLLTVTGRRLEDRLSSSMLRERARRAAVMPRATIIRHGDIAEQIARCAATERTGLVVYGIERQVAPAARGDRDRGPQGQIGFRVSGARGCVMTVSRGVAAVSVVALVALATLRGHAQGTFGDSNAITQFQRAVDAYSFQHRQVQRRVGENADQATLAAALRAARPGAADGDLFTPLVATAFRHRIATALKAPGCRIGSGTSGSEVPRVGVLAIGTDAVPACVLNVLPRLPAELEYRTTSVALIILDTHARMVVDVLHGAFPMPL